MYEWVKNYTTRNAFREANVVRLTSRWTNNALESDIFKTRKPKMLVYGFSKTVFHKNTLLSGQIDLKSRNGVYLNSGCLQIG